MAGLPLSPLRHSRSSSPLLPRLRPLRVAGLRVSPQLHRRSPSGHDLSSSSSFLGPPRRSLFLTRAREGTEPVEDDFRFLDEDGMVRDMDGYLNHLSLEYDSIWDTKPSWCQPWTILLTGLVVTGCSWAILHSVMITAVVFTLICAWWFIFLYAYPKAYEDMIAQRRQNVVTGVEDTFGVQKNL